MWIREPWIIHDSLPLLVTQFSHQQPPGCFDVSHGHCNFIKGSRPTALCCCDCTPLLYSALHCTRWTVLHGVVSVCFTFCLTRDDAETLDKAAAALVFLSFTCPESVIYATDHFSWQSRQLPTKKKKEKRNKKNPRSNPVMLLRPHSVWGFWMTFISIHCMQSCRRP